MLRYYNRKASQVCSKLIDDRGRLLDIEIREVIHSLIAVALCVHENEMNATICFNDPSIYV